MAVSWRGSGGAEDDTAAAVPCSIHGQMACDALTGETTRNERAGADEVHPPRARGGRSLCKPQGPVAAHRGLGSGSGPWKP
jgi:hypothetical protein